MILKFKSFTLFEYTKTKKNRYENQTINPFGICDDRDVLICSKADLREDVEEC